jgi:CubicO group peptidase (beta-lactamase class C family)
MTTTWDGWFGLGGEIQGAPAVVFPTVDTIDIYVRGMDDRLWQKWWDGKKWNPSDSDWAQHDDGKFRLASAPFAVANGLNFRDVYAVGKDSHVYHKFWDGKSWTGWFDLGGSIKGAPAVVNPTPSTIDIYARDKNDRLVQKWWDGKKWNPSDSGWAPHEDGGFRIGSSPSVIANGADFREVFVRGKDGGVYHKFWNGKKWSAWFGLGGQIKDAPSAVQVHPGFYDIYVRGMDDRLWQKWWDGTKWNPSDLGWMMHHDGNDRLGSSPAAASQGDSFRDVYVRSPGGDVWHKSWENQRHSNAMEIRADATKSGKIDKAAKAHIGTNSPGLSIAVIKSGQIVHLAGYGLQSLKTKKPITSETMFHMASCGKQFTGLGIVMLKEAGALGYDDHIGKHIPQLKKYSSKVTLRRLLHHLSDIRDLYDESGTASMLNQSSNPTNAHIIKTYVALGCPTNPNPAGPGDEYVYSNSEYDLLGSVIESASGQSYVEFFKKRIFEPFGMTDTWSFPETARLNDFNRAVGYTRDNAVFIEQPGSILDLIVGSGSFYSSVFDLCAYEEALAKNMLVTGPSLKTAYTSGKTNAGASVNYGFGWGLNASAGYADHGGGWTGFASQVRRYTNQPLSIYILSNNSVLDLSFIMETAAKAYK